MVKSIATMKKMIKNLMLVAVAAIAFVACSQEGNEVNISTKKTAFEFTASFDAETRSSFDGLNENGDAYKSVWNGGEMVRLIARDGEGKFIEAAYPNVKLVGDDNTTARISGEFNQDLTNVATIEAYVGGWYHDTEYSYMNLNIYQTPTDDSVDTYVHTLKATADWDGVSAAKLHFQHAASYGRMTLPQFDSLAGGEVVVSFTTPDSSYGYTMYADKLTNNVVWFACDAFEVTAFTVKAKVGGKTYSKEITGVNRALYFETGKVTEFTVKDLQEEVVPDTATATLVTDIIFNGYNPYDVKFEFATGEKVTLRFNTDGTQYLHLGDWQSNDWQQPHYISQAQLNGVGTYVSSCKVAYDETTLYTVNFAVNGTEYTYVGAIEGLVAPEECDCFAGGGDEPGTGEGGDTGATELNITGHEIGYTNNGEYEILFIDSVGDKHVIDFLFSSGAVETGTFSSNLGNLATEYCKYRFGASDGNVKMTSVNAIVTDNGNNNFTFDVTFEANGTTYHFVYTGNF